MFYIAGTLDASFSKGTCCCCVSLLGQIDAVLTKSEGNGRNLVAQVSNVNSIYKAVARNELPSANFKSTLHQVIMRPSFYRTQTSIPIMPL